MPRKNTGETAAKRATTPRRSPAGSRTRKRSAASTPAMSAANQSTQSHTEAQIRERAYYIFLEREHGAGDALGDWLQAEQELNGRRPSGSG
jgi:hypothetical protein